MTLNYPLPARFLRPRHLHAAQVRALSKQPRVVRRGDGDDEGSGGTEMPVRWVRVDPDGEWAAHIVVAQTDAMLATQLSLDPDVVGRIQARRAPACPPRFLPL